MASASGSMRRSRTLAAMVVVSVSSVVTPMTPIWTPARSKSTEGTT